MLHLFSFFSFLLVLELHDLQLCYNSQVVVAPFFPLLFSPSTSFSLRQALHLHFISYYFKLLLQIRIPLAFALSEWTDTKLQKTYCCCCIQRKKEKALGLHPTKQQGLMLTSYHHLAKSHWFKRKKKFWVKILLGCAHPCPSTSTPLKFPMILVLVKQK